MRNTLCLGSLSTEDALGCHATRREAAPVGASTGAPPWSLAASCVRRFGEGSPCNGFSQGLSEKIAKLEMWQQQKLSKNVYSE